MVVTVPYESPLGPRLAFIGKAPGDDEMDRGRPFVGPSGRVFDSLLRSAGIDRKQVWVGNVFDTQAPDNDTAAWERDPAIAGPALERLAKEMEYAKPTVIVPMGDVALWALTEHRDISAHRGAVMSATRVAPGVKIVPTFHPAHVMRQWKYFVVVVDDIIKAAREADRGPAIVYPDRKLWIEPTLTEVVAFADRCVAYPGELGVDIETGWGQITCIGFSLGSAEAMCIPFVDMRQPNRSYWGSPEIEFKARAQVKRVLECPVPKCGQNYGGYDWYWIYHKWGVATMNYRDDTRLIHHAIYPEMDKSLAFMGNTYGDQGPWKTLGWRGTEKKDD